MNVRPEVERFIRKFETCQLTAYPDRSGRWTIGYGWQGWHGDPVPYEGMVITQEVADQLFASALAGFSGEMTAYLKAKGVQLDNDWQYSALVSLAYNKGMTTFSKSEVVVHLMNASEKWHMADAMWAFTHRTMETHPVTGEPIPRLDWMTDEHGNEVKWLLGLARRRVNEAAIFDGILEYTKV